MTWKSHIAIASAVAIPFNPTMLPLAVLGSVSPDALEMIYNFFYPKKKIKHRGVTHYLTIPITLIALSFVLFEPLSQMVFWLGIGYLSHWFADSLTISGVPVSHLSKNNIHFLNGKLRTGAVEEYLIAFGFLAVVLIIFNPLKNNFIFEREQNGKISYNVYYNDYGKFYDQKIIDEKQYKETRFKFF